MPTATVARTAVRAAMRGPLLTRDYLDLVLYDKAVGYFNTGARIRQNMRPLDFRALRGENQYRQVVADLYRHEQGWTTPVEIFQAGTNV